MNKYGRLAMEHWQAAAPSRVAELEDVEAFFTSLGEQVMDQVVDLLPQIQGPDKPGEEYLAKVGRLNMARKQAEEIVLNDLVWIKEPEPSDLVEELQLLLLDSMSPMMIAQKQYQMTVNAGIDALTQGEETLTFGGWEQEFLDQMEALLPWVTLDKPVEEMSEAELKERIQGIQAFEDWRESQRQPGIPIQ